MDLPHYFVGTTREHYIILFGAAAAIGICAGLVGAWLGAYLGARRAVRTAQLSGSQPITVAQLSPVMQALDDISLEVERIAEAQRFTAKVLAERSPVVLPRMPSRSITPH